jgi:NAD+ kinase
MRFGVTANPHIEGALDAAKAIVATLEPAHSVLVEADLAHALGRRGLPLAHMDVDVVLAVGGDGTILRALQLTKAPILGVNSGSLGFLAEIDAPDFGRHVDRLVRGDHRIEERLRLKVEVDGQRLFDCTNEAVVHTAHVAKMRHFEVSVDGSVLQRVRADGVIVATPTGSTSYSMSAGGPIVDPRLDAILITAIAPFQPSMRPYAVPASSVVRVRLVKPRECLLVLDGQHEVNLKGVEDATFTASDVRSRFVRFRGDDFYRRIEEKLRRG